MRRCMIVEMRVVILVDMIEMIEMVDMTDMVEMIDMVDMTVMIVMVIMIDMIEMIEMTAMTILVTRIAIVEASTTTVIITIMIQRTRTLRRRRISPNIVHKNPRSTTQEIPFAPTPLTAVITYAPSQS